jgi:D-serine deaminase-like pyridoxal phosphate-dependent protein
MSTTASATRQPVSWRELSLLPVNADEISSPALILRWEAVEENLRRMIERVGSPDRLRPHLKTHKLPQIIARLAELGVTKAKAATIAEAEMAATAGACDVLLAFPAIGPTIPRLVELVRAFPAVQFSALVDDPVALDALGAACHRAGLELPVFVDLDVGMHRTGIAPDDAAAALYTRLARTPGLRPAGLHAYDGHLSQSDLAERTAACDAGFATVVALRDRLRAAGLPVPVIVAGGTPTFPIHARRPDVECSPGTCVLWDAGYAHKVPDLDFVPAAILLTRVISRPGPNRLCLDLGHKAVASEMPQPRAIFPALPDAKPVVHSEEHLVLETAHAADFPVGTVLGAIPWHICPTVALQSFVHVSHANRVDAVWPVVARTRRLSA